MESIKTVGIKELKNNLSAFIREIKRGFRILVTDRDEVVAELCEPLSPPVKSEQSLLDVWIKAGKIRLASRARKSLLVSPLRLKAGTSLRLLNEDRDE